MIICWPWPYECSKSKIQTDHLHHLGRYHKDKVFVGHPVRFVLVGEELVFLRSFASSTTLYATACYLKRTRHYIKYMYNITLSVYSLRTRVYYGVSLYAHTHTHAHVHTHTHIIYKYTLRSIELYNFDFICQCHTIVQCR